MLPSARSVLYAFSSGPTTPTKGVMSRYASPMGTTRSVVIGILLQSTTWCNGVTQHWPRLVIGWMTVLVYQLFSQHEWACLVEGFNTTVSAGVLNLPDKRVNPGCWLRSGFESPRRQPCFKPFSGSYQLWTLHWSDILCALLGLRANKLNPNPFFP